ncbi:hypothetical protein MY4824_005901 [Beauveria thailandica]
MKLAAVIFAVATAANSIPMEQHKCDSLCTAEYDPIACSNGAVYSNACELAKAKVGVLGIRLMKEMYVVLCDSSGEMRDSHDIQCNPQAFDDVTCGSGVRE